MKSLRANDGVDGSVSKRDIFRRAFFRFDVGIQLCQVTQHRWDRFYRDHGCSRGKKFWNELPGACAKIKHCLAVAQPNVMPQPAFDFGRIVRAALDVSARFRRVAVGSGVMNGLHTWL